jgi:protein SCO1/2
MRALFGTARRWIGASRKRAAIRAGILMAVVVLSCAAMLGCTSRDSAAASARPAPPLEGVDTAGGTFRMAEQRGRVVVLTFGFTSCPDVCPTTLAKAKGMIQRLGERAKDVAFAFVSVDPERDSPERLRTYVAGFDPTFHGVYVERERLGPLLAAYEVVATKREANSLRTGELSKFYSIDHTGGFILVDKAGQIRARVPPAASTDALVESVTRLLEGQGTVRVLSPHARVTPGASVGAAYLRVQNEDTRPDRLASVASPDAKEAELHEVIDDHGVMRMIPRPEGFVIGARSTLDLAEGGKHVMLFGVEPRTSAAPLTLRLRFERAGTVEVSVPVAQGGAVADR